jgi:hypothetical protein
LLAKFGVADRLALSREASLGRMPTNSSGQLTPESLFGFPLRSQQTTPEDQPAASAPEKAAASPRETPRARHRMLSMFSRERFAT